MQSSPSWRFFFLVFGLLLLANPAMADEVFGATADTAVTIDGGTAEIHPPIEETGMACQAIDDACTADEGGCLEAIRKNRALCIRASRARCQTAQGTAFFSHEWAQIKRIYPPWQEVHELTPPFMGCRAND